VALRPGFRRVAIVEVGRYARVGTRPVKEGSETS